MESRDYQDGFEDFLQEKADQYKLYPSDRVWNAINNRLHPRPKWSYLVVAAIFLGLGIGGKVYDSSLINDPSIYTENERFSTGADNQLTSTTAPAPVIALNSRPGGSEKLSSTIEDATNAARSVRSSNGMAPGSDRTVRPTKTYIPFTDLTSSLPASALTTGVETRVINMFETETEPADDHNENTKEDALPAGAETGNQILDEAAIQEAIERGTMHTNSIATVENTYKKDFTVANIPAPEKANSIKVLKPRHLRIGWQLYASPTVSYRKLSGEGMSYYNNNSMSSVFTADVEKSVRHKPAIGFELGTALTYATSSRFRFKTGLQLNINRYDIEAFSYVPEVAPLTRGGIGHTTINAISTYRNHNGFSKTWLKNQHIMMSLPLGAEITLFGNEKVKFNIGGTLQPTFVLNNQAYMISTNMKNYAKEPSLYKNFNVAAGAEAYLSIKSGSLRWMIGPQFRYQIFSSYKKEYPINEHLTDYGFKIGISR